MKKIDFLVSDLCAEIDALREELALARDEARSWREKHAQLVDESISHSHKMTGQLLTLALTRKIT